MLLEGRWRLASTSAAADAELRMRRWGEGTHGCCG
uniref:Uncharacterized protein n=1 Tax=Arundo donax TaxID=35708 RepID=A0A0A8ZAY8_ARUDO